MENLRDDQFRLRRPGVGGKKTKSTGGEEKGKGD